MVELVRAVNAIAVSGGRRIVYTGLRISSATGKELVGWRLNRLSYPTVDGMATTCAAAAACARSWTPENQVTIVLLDNREDLRLSSSAPSMVVEEWQLNTGNQGWCSWETAPFTEADRGTRGRPVFCCARRMSARALFTTAVATSQTSNMQRRVIRRHDEHFYMVCAARRLRLEGDRRICYILFFSALNNNKIKSEYFIYW